MVHMSLACWIFPFICKSDLLSIYKFALVSQPLVTQCVVHDQQHQQHLGVSQECGISGSLNRNLHVTKTTRRFVCTGNLGMLWHDPEKSQLSAIL